MEARRVEKRNRRPVSCETCRVHKLRCNRELPCDACIRRKRAAQCRYAANARRSKTPPASGGQAASVAERLGHLETLVTSLIAGDSIVQRKDPPEQRQQPLEAASSSRSNSDSTITLTESGDQTAVASGYVDPSHWRAVLESIKEVQDHLSAASVASPDELSESILLPGGCGKSSATLEDILQHLPRQPICDMLVSQYFHSRFQVLGIIHPGRFRREYDQFWDADSPSQVSPLWLALLFAILGIATCLRHISSLCDPSPSASLSALPLVPTMQEQTARCLALGRFAMASASAYTLETLLLCLQTSFMARRQQTPPTLLWFDMGTILRQAVRLGYHRDPANQSKGVASVLDAEMRRRVWMNIVQIDALMSFQMGLPSMVADDWSDTLPPRNLQDDDLRQDMDQLPPARPLEEHTPVQYILCKSSVMAVFKKIGAHVQRQARAATASPTETTETLALDAELRAAYTRVPDCLQGRDIRRCTMETATQILERCSIELLYCKGLMVLHRSAMSEGDDASSRSACVEAALAALDRQADLYQASQPGGRLYEDRWMIMSLMVQDFLLAAMVVCLHVSRTVAHAARPFSLSDSDCLLAREYRALQAAQQFWAARQSVSNEAHLALLALTLMLQKVEQRASSTDGTDMVLEPMSESLLAWDLELPYAEPMAQMIDDFETVDWDLLDQYFQT